MKIYLRFYLRYFFVKISFISVKKKDDTKDILFFLIAWVTETSIIKDAIHGQ